MAAEEDVADVTMDDGGEEENEEKVIAKVVENEDEEDESDGESSDSDEEENDETTKLISQLESDIAANKYNYDAYVKLISCLRKCGLLEKLRSTREAMNVHYPLTPALWREWAQDEARLVARQEDVGAVEALYERGVQEYQSVMLWLDYFEFMMKQVADASQVKAEKLGKKRRLFERALAAVGLHYTEGGKIWKAFREMENSLLLNLKGSENEAKQVETVRSLFHRHLTVPSAALAETMNEYKEWEMQEGVQIGDESDETAGLPSHVASAYRKALQMSASREPLEEKIANDPDGSAEQLQHYMDYITMEEATGEPARIQVIYERTITAFPVNHDVWIRYTQYLEKNLKVASVLRSVYARAVRNCPWVQSLWKNYLLTLERSHANENEIAAVFQQSLLGGFQTPEEYLDLHLTRADGLRRRIMTIEDENEKQRFLALLHDAFDGASQFMSTVFPDYVDRSFQLHAYWAHTEAHLAKDLAAARGVWENLIKSCGWMSEVWQGYISMELSLKNIKEARSIYRNCYSRRLEGNGTQLMCYAWLRFEREHGTLEDYDRAWMKVGPRLAEVQSMQAQQEGTAAQPSAQVNASTEHAAKVSRKSKQVPSDSGTGKRKRPDDSGFKEPKPVLKRSKASEQDEPSQVVPQEGKSDSAQDVLGDRSKEDGGADQARGKRPKETRKLYHDECTAFLKNLSFEITEDELREFFSDSCGVKEVRLLWDKFKDQPRGLAYVEFEDEESLAAAVAKDGQELGGRIISIARSAPTKGGRGGGAVWGGRGGIGQRGGRHGGGGGGEQGDENGSVGRGRGGSGRGARPGLGLGHRRGGKVGITSSTTFAVPRAVVRPLGWAAGQASTGDEAPKSNDEFRNMFLTKKS
ncbi:hypothetical protein R1flu_027669 [Riccia fluitans]|uniref:RRM domain-containing protein n=1 Tax=Riccia fluitans TaxID=41844 RepID=A0ABD1XJK4_9MARC